MNDNDNKKVEIFGMKEGPSKKEVFEKYFRNEHLAIGVLHFKDRNKRYFYYGKIKEINDEGIVFETDDTSIKYILYDDIRSISIIGGGTK